MRWAILLSLLALAACAGCSQQACRPCGPGVLGNIFVPQGAGGADFRDACHVHDACYATDCPRKECDANFRDNLLCACECADHPAVCRLQAWKWYWLTRIGGGPAHRISQRERACEGGCCDGAIDPASATADDAPAGHDDIAMPTIE